MSAFAFRRRPRATDPLLTGEELLRNLMQEHAGLLQQVNHLRAAQPRVDYDPLTGLGTRRYFEARVVEELSRAERNPSCAGSLLLMDVDQLAAARAHHGPAVSNRTLRWVAKVLRETLRVSDVACRGGDRFLAVLCDTDRFGAAEVVGRLLGEIHRAEGRRWAPQAVSVGVAAWPEDGFTLSALITIAAVRLLEDRQRRRGLLRPRLALLP
jgi:diguanylate cyclase (GGDEF)-like protein